MAGCARALGLAAGILLVSGCTKWDDWLPGSPFTPDQPEGAVTLTGKMNVDPITSSGPGCPPGGTVFWGTVMNTGDLDVTDVEITISAYDGAGGLLGTFRDDVYNGEVEEIELDDGTKVTVVGTSLDVDQSGTFNVCAPVPSGGVARTEYQTSFVTVETVK
jgi:hypothetical protein